jgi:hypothetical protein
MIQDLIERRLGVTYHPPCEGGALGWIALTADFDAVGRWGHSGNILFLGLFSVFRSMGDTKMATIEHRREKYRVKVRRKSAPPLTATFVRLTDAKKWARITEAAVFEGRHFPTNKAKHHTLADLIDRYMREVLPHKNRSSIYMQTLQLEWWKERLGSYRLADVNPVFLYRTLL